MQIGSNIENLPQVPSTQRSDSASAPAASTPKVSAVSQDTAKLSSVSGQITQGANSEEVRLDKVAAIQSALAAGTYSVSPSQVASRVIDAMLERKQ